MKRREFIGGLGCAMSVAFIRSASAMPPLTIADGTPIGRGKLLVVHLADVIDGAEPGPRVGFIVSKAVGNAVIRNRVKRRLRHLVRERIDALPTSGLLVVRANPASSAASYRELAGELDRCLLRVLED